ncbi:DNA-binding response regulator [Saccharothrix sp. AJ9571]|nr:DNA-binding response regulator [Saccharothrix sp. AJ9571]
MGGAMIRDDQPETAILCVADELHRVGLKSLLTGQEALHVVGDFSDGEAALSALDRLNPDITIVDSSETTAEFLRKLVFDRPATPSVIMLIKDGNQCARLSELLHSGARVITPLPGNLDEMHQLTVAIKAASSGNHWLAPQLHQLLREHQLRSATAVRRRPAQLAIMDDHPPIRFAIRTLLDSGREVEIAHECASPETLLTTARNSEIDIVIADLHLIEPRKWMAFCQELRRHAPEVRLLVYSSQRAPEYVATALNAGADSYVHKGASCGELVDAVHRTCSGERVWLIDPSARVGENSTGLLERIRLTRREREVIVLLLHRHSNDEIARELCLARQTVKNHVSSILRKVGANNRRELFEQLHSPRRGRDDRPSPGPGGWRRAARG